LDTSRRTAAEDTGLLARLEALSHLGEENALARMAQLLVAVLLFMLELLPVLMRSFLYDQVDELEEIWQLDEYVRVAGQEYIGRSLEKHKERITESERDEVEELMRELATDQIRAFKQKVEQVTRNSARSR
jgi:Domain of unknown function (DUF4407)